MPTVRCSICHTEFTSIAEYDAYRCAHADHDFSDVPYQFDHSKGAQYTILVAGPPEAGKSYFIYSLLYELLDQNNRHLRDFFYRQGFHIELISDKARTQYELFRRRLFSSPLDLTNPIDPQNRTPILLKITKNGRQRQQIKLCFFDISGENFTGAGAIEFINNEARIHKAKGIIYLQDPFTDEGLNSLLVNNNPEHIYDNNYILDNIFRSIKRKQSRKAQKLDIPLAFCVSMFDLLEHNIPNRIAPNPYLELVDLVNGEGQFNKAAVRRKSKEIEQLISEHTKVDLYDLRNKYQRQRFFSISAIGHDDVDDIAHRGIQSKGVLAPLLWILAERGFIEQYKY